MFSFFTFTTFTAKRFTSVCHHIDEYTTIILRVHLLTLLKKRIIKSKTVSCYRLIFFFVTVRDCFLFYNSLKIIFMNNRTMKKHKTYLFICRNLSGGLFVFFCFVLISFVFVFCFLCIFVFVCLFFCLFTFSYK